MAALRIEILQSDLDGFDAIVTGGTGDDVPGADGLEHPADEERSSEDPRQRVAIHVEGDAHGVRVSALVAEVSRDQRNLVSRDDLFTWSGPRRLVATAAENGRAPSEKLKAWR